MPRLEWTAPAVADLLEIVAYIADRNPDAAQALKDEIEAKAARLPERPRIYRRGRVEGTREMVVLPNYLVVYEENPERVRILRVLHAAPSGPERPQRRSDPFPPSTLVQPQDGATCAVLGSPARPAHVLFPSRSCPCSLTGPAVGTGRLS